MENQSITANLKRERRRCSNTVQDYPTAQGTSVFTSLISIKLFFFFKARSLESRFPRIRKPSRQPPYSINLLLFGNSLQTFPFSRFRPAAQKCHSFHQLGVAGRTAAPRRPINRVPDGLRLDFSLLTHQWPGCLKTNTSLSLSALFS